MLNTVNGCERGRVSALSELFSKTPSVIIKPPSIEVRKINISKELKAQLEMACENMKGNRNDIAEKHHAKMKVRAEAARMKADEVNAIMKNIQEMASTLQKGAQNGAPPPPPPLPTDEQMIACRISSSWNLASSNNQPETVTLSRSSQQIVESIKNKAARGDHNIATFPGDFLEQLKLKLQQRNQKISAE